MCVCVCVCVWLVVPGHQECDAPAKVRSSFDVVHMEKETPVCSTTRGAIAPVNM